MNLFGLTPIIFGRFVANPNSQAWGLK